MKIQIAVDYGYSPPRMSVTAKFGTETAGLSVEADTDGLFDTEVIAFALEALKDFAKKREAVKS